MARARMDFGRGHRHRATDVGRRRGAGQPGRTGGGVNGAGTPTGPWPCTAHRPQSWATIAGLAVVAVENVRRRVRSEQRLRDQQQGDGTVTVLWAQRRDAHSWASPRRWPGARVEAAGVPGVALAQQRYRQTGAAQAAVVGLDRLTRVFRTGRG